MSGRIQGMWRNEVGGSLGAQKWGTGNLDSRGREIIRSEKVPEDQDEMALEESAERGGAF